LILLLLFAGPASASPGLQGVHQDSPRLTWLTPGFLPPDGLLTVGLRGGPANIGYNPTGSPAQYQVWRAGLFADWTPLPGLAVSWSQPLVLWSNYQAAGAEQSGSGLADGQWRVAAAAPGLPDWLGLTGWGGGNIPLGSEATSEGAFSPEMGLTLGLSFWRESQLPEMRLHATLGTRFNGNEAAGYGAQAYADTGVPQPQPWFPQYPDAASSGGDRNNDFLIWGLGVEFRNGTTALWLEYSEYALWKAAQVYPREDQKILAAGLRWGLEEGWALQVDYQVGYHKDELYFTDWYPRLPINGYTVACTRQFSFGGRDRDGDDVLDRRDRCPGEPEDHDGFEDEDGCPDDDNDQDGIPDDYDDAPLEPEDFDGFQDGDGKPDPDNDRDGILDLYDLCPDEPEDYDGYQDTDGCPEELQDRDLDGIPDEDDLCPDSPEDSDGFQDQDGCPDPDNDLDGIDDRLDACPNEAEDYDGDRDQDGCPDLSPEEEAQQQAPPAAPESTRKK
jgi:hypothetical protein